MVLFSTRTKYQKWKYCHKNTSTALKKIIEPLHCNEIHSKFVTINAKTTICIDICLVISVHYGKELASFSNLQLIFLSQVMVLMSS